MRKVVCISRNEKYEHQRKLEVSGVYLAEENTDSYVIYIIPPNNIDIHSSKYEYRLGSYHKYQFIDWLEYNRENKLNELGI